MTISLQSENHWKSYETVDIESFRPIARRQIKSLERNKESAGTWCSPRS